MCCWPYALHMHSSCVHPQPCARHRNCSQLDLPRLWQPLRLRAWPFSSGVDSCRTSFRVNIVMTSHPRVR